MITSMPPTQCLLFLLYAWSCGCLNLVQSMTTAFYETIRIVIDPHQFGGVLVAEDIVKDYDTTDWNNLVQYWYMASWNET